MGEVVGWKPDPTTLWLPKGYHLKNIQDTWWLSVEGPEGVLRHMVSDFDSGQAKDFAAAMNQASGDLAYAKMQVEFAQQAMALMLMAYVSRGSVVRNVDVELGALQAVVEQSAGDMQATAKGQLEVLLAQVKASQVQGG